jgi:hypothetical protein
MFHTLTNFQKQLIQDYQRLAKEVYFHGLDENALPVISFTDNVGRREPFAILHRPRKTMQVRAYAVGYENKGRAFPVERTTTEPAYPLRDLTDNELDNMDLRSYELIASLKRA